MAETYAFDEYNQLNQYESVTFDSQTQPMDYDLNGNVIQYDDKTFTYDYLNRMLTAADGSALNESYAYDSMGRRVLVDAEGTQTVYVYDGAQVIAEYSLVGTTLTLQKRFICGPGIDEPICMIVYAAGSESGRYFYHFDGQGNVIALSNSSGNVVEEYEYDVYGLVSVQSLGQTWDRSQYGNPYLFTGRRWDSTTELYYYRMRDYSPDAGRFLQPDPLGYFDGMNLYAYCGNNPLNWIEPWGLCKTDELEKDIRNELQDIVNDAQSWHQTSRGYRPYVNDCSVQAAYMIDAVTNERRIYWTPSLIKGASRTWGIFGFKGNHTATLWTPSQRAEQLGFRPVAIDPFKPPFGSKDIDLYSEEEFRRKYPYPQND